VFNDTSSLTAEVTQVVKLRAANLTTTNNFNAFNQWRVNWEYALYAFAVRNLTYCKALVDAAARTSNANAFVSLYTCTVTFSNANEYANGVTWGEFWQSALSCDFRCLFSFELLNN